jgi:hypothetical protein
MITIPVTMLAFKGILTTVVASYPLFTNPGLFVAHQSLITTSIEKAIPTLISSTTYSRTGYYHQAKKYY